VNHARHYTVLKQWYEGSTST